MRTSGSQNPHTPNATDVQSASRLITQARSGLSAALAALEGARRISLSEARDVLDEAVSAGLVNPDDTFVPALRARLSEIGVRSIAQLTRGQADELTASVAVI